jgi:hypothetical protein
VQLVLQQTPSTHEPLVHSPPAPHATPLLFFGTHVVPPQYEVDTQSAALAQLVRHDVALAAHVYGLQLVTAPAQIPAPLHWLVVSEPAVHDGPEQALFGSVPAAIGAQTPSAPPPFFAALQASQPAVQALSQQTPSAHEPLVQRAACLERAGRYTCIGIEGAFAAAVSTAGHSRDNRQKRQDRDEPSAPFPRESRLDHEQGTRATRHTFHHEALELARPTSGSRRRDGSRDR